MKGISLLFLVFAVVAAGGAFVAWYVYVRPMPERTGRGVIVGKVFRPAHTVTRPPSGTRRQDWSGREFQVPDQYEFTIRLDEGGAEATYSLGTAAAEAFQEGDAVELHYQERELPGLWHRIYVLDMRAKGQDR